MICFRLREYMRSESEKSFDECQIKRARMKSLGLAYLSHQNKSLAQSFRYMRNKPTIIAFKTPSLENCEARDSSSSLGSVGGKSTNLFVIRVDRVLFVYVHRSKFFYESRATGRRGKNRPRFSTNFCAHKTNKLSCW